MLAEVLAHVDEFACSLYHSEGCFSYSLGRADKGDHRAVGSLATVDVQYPNAIDRAYSLGDGVDGMDVTPFTEVGHTLNELRIDN